MFVQVLAASGKVRGNAARRLGSVCGGFTAAGAALRGATRARLLDGGLAWRRAVSGRTAASAGLPAVRMTETPVDASGGEQEVTSSGAEAGAYGTPASNATSPSTPFAGGDMGDSAPGRFGERRDGLRSRRPPMKLRRRPLQYNLTDLREGQKLEGTVVSVVPYGAFVDCGAFYTDQMDEADAPPASPAAAAANGASDDAVAAERGGSESAQAPTPFDGLVHIRDFSYDFVLSPHNMVSLGDNVTVYVKYADIANHKLALSFLPPIDAPPSEKGLTPSSRDLYAVSETPDGRRNYEYADADKRRAVGSFNLDDEVRGVVRRVTNFGAFLDVGAEVDAFLHVSDMWGRQPRRTLEFLKIGQVVRARVCEVNQTMRRLRLRALTSTDEQ